MLKKEHCKRLKSEKPKIFLCEMIETNDKNGF